MLVSKALSEFGVSSPVAPDAFRPLDPRSVTVEELTTFIKQPSRRRTDSSQDRSLVLPFEIAGRSRGNLVVSQWMDAGAPYQAMLNLILSAPHVDQLQLTLVTERIAVERDASSRLVDRSMNGRMGLELVLNGSCHRVSPFETIATNRSLNRWFDKWLDQRSLTVDGFHKLGGKLFLLKCRQFIINRGTSAKAWETFRGTNLVSADEGIDRLTEQLTAGIARWFMANQDQAGALPYKYWPSSGNYSTADNPIRRLMASVAFNRLADCLGRQDIRLAAKRNLAYNLQRFYRVRDDQGVIEWQDVVKLGALAIAGLAIIESPFSATWTTELSEIRKTIDGLWTPSGAFRTFLHPADRNDNQNFYPGEALVFWATCLSKSMDEPLLNRTLRSVDYYRQHFRKQPNPAFVPWHSQAVTMLYRQTGDVSLRDYVFEMNDWILPHQQWSGGLDPDYVGRFYTPAEPSYGPPHASATGVYLEGLVDALDLAIEAGDTSRAEAYHIAIKRGIRSIAQLQFKDEVDAYYISCRERVIGAIRTESDNNEIRIDNMQHALAALLKYKTLRSRWRVDARPDYRQQVA